ncbi:MAG: metal-dependent transcriptional regulator [Anaerolineales bacterium]
MLSPAGEDYLKAIYELGREGDGGAVTTSALAEHLNIRKGSVTGMLKKLARVRPGLVHYERYRGVRLTPAGERAALQVLRHHRLLERFLSERLGFGWDEVHTEADRLEHVISEDLEERIATQLGNPAIDPHGDPIPRRDGSLPRIKEISLTDLPPGQTAFVSRVGSEDPALLRYLTKLGLQLHARVQVTLKGPFEGPIEVRLLDGRTRHALSRRVTDQVYVTVGTPQGRR